MSHDNEGWSGELNTFETSGGETLSAAAARVFRDRESKKGVPPVPVPTLQLEMSQRVKATAEHLTGPQEV